MPRDFIRTPNIGIVDVDGNPDVSQVTGTLRSYLMTPVAQASANFSNAKECYANATGVKAFRVIPCIAVTAGEAVVYAWSTTASDQTAVKATIDAITTTSTGTWDAPAGGAHSGALTFSAQSKDTPWIKWDGTNLIKTIGMELTASVAGLNAVLETIE